MITFSPLNLATNAADLARLYSSTQPEPTTVENIRDWWALRKNEFRVTMLAYENGQAIGYWDVDRETWMRPGHFFIKVIVAPEMRGRGLGRQMYAAALESARGLGATHLDSSVRENDPVSIAFSERRGFKVEVHLFESTLDLSSFDESRFDGLLKRLGEQGIRFFSLAEVGMTVENRHKLYEINRTAALTDPGSNGTFPDYDAFSMNVFEASWFRAETQILAADGERWVGLAAISISKKDDHAYNAFTGVLSEYRGRGLAQALKLQTILLARREGIRHVRTNNASNNAPMLAINRKLGYKPEPGIYRLVCDLV